ncbi:MAG: [FeFe] hydrogenase H-cluster maturation GTPase HydF [Oscillospiraceae bacterium]|nr:[FeFe] hydrogenase H-cluster maturation GTPase HydF [Oscillospiraceae bacterium]
MSLNSTPNANRIHIGIFGKRNAGKSSLINALTNQPIAIVSDVAGTTTDPVSKAMELLPLGPVVITDTAGIDDIGELGKMRVERSLSQLAKTDIAVYAVSCENDIDSSDMQVIERIRKMNIPLIVVRTKSDKAEGFKAGNGEIVLSSATGEGIEELKKALVLALPDKEKSCLISDIVGEGDAVVLVIPIDESAPKGRLILPQQQVLREALDSKAIAIATQPDTLIKTIETLNAPPKLVITDSQVFGKVSKMLPDSIPLTSFSILMARYKGILTTASKAAMSIESLEDGDKVLISEGCTHHRQCGDIGTVKLPAWIKKHTGKELKFEFTSGTDFPDNLSDYKLIVHCGGCMLTEREVTYRYKSAKAQNVPITNYGILIAYMNGILERTLKPFEK